MRLDSVLWEQASGVDAVREQLYALGFGTTRAAKKPKDTLYTMLFIRAEDPILQIPSPGTFQERLSPEGSGFYWTPPDEAEGWLGLWVGKADDALSSLKSLWLHGTGLSNQKFLMDVLAHPWIKNGNFYSGFLQEEFVPDFRPPLAVLQFAVNICAQWADKGLESDWRILQYKIKPKKMEKAPKKGKWHDEEAGEKYSYSVYECPFGHWSVRVGDWCFRAKQMNALEKGLWIKSLVKGVVRKRLKSSPFVWVQSFDRWVPHGGPKDAKVLQWKVKVGDKVEVGQPLAELTRAKS